SDGAELGSIEAVVPSIVRWDNIAPLWLAMKGGTITARNSDSHADSFVIDITIEEPQSAHQRLWTGPLLKVIIDSVVAALNSHDGDSLSECATRLAMKLKRPVD